MKEITIENQQPVESVQDATLYSVHLSTIIASILALVLSSRYLKKLSIVAKWANVIGHAIRLAQDEGLLKPSKLDDWLIEVSKVYLDKHPELDKNPKDIAHILISPEVVAELIDKNPEEVVTQLASNAIKDTYSEI